MTEHNAEYITPEDDKHWKEMRARDVTSTESAALYGLSPYTTELELFYRKQSGEAVDFGDNHRMKAGRFLEPSIAQLAGDELGCKVIPFKRYARTHDKMGSSFDYEIIHDNTKDTRHDLEGWLLEVKNVDFLIYRDQWEDNEAPDHIEVQCQHQLEITGRPGIIIACLVGGNDLKIIKRERDVKMGANIRKRIEKFWDDVEINKPPTPDFSRDADFIISLYQSAGEKVISFEEETDEADLIKKYRELRQTYTQADKDSKSIKAKLLTLIGDEPSKVLCGLLTLTCGEIGETFVEAYTRKGYRNFRVTERKPKKEKIKK